MILGGHDIGSVGWLLQVEHSFEEFVDDQIGFDAEDAIAFEDVGPLPLDDTEVGLDEGAEIVAEGIVDDVGAGAIGIAVGYDGGEGVFEEEGGLGFGLEDELGPHFAVFVIHVHEAGEVAGAQVWMG